MKSLWHADAALPEFPTLQNEIKTDVLVIGGGITGILTAFFLHQKGIPYVLAEKSRICSGTTQNTTAKITFQHRLLYHKILKSYGIETAQGYLMANQMAFEKYAAFCQKIDCHYERKDHFVYTQNDRRKLEEELTALEKIGYPARFCEALPLPLQTAGAVCFPDQAQFQPLRFLAGIAKDLHIYEHTFVRALAHETTGITAVTDSGKIRAEHVIVATHFPFLNKHGSYFLKLYQNRSYVIALSPAQDVQGMYADENQNGLSFRNYKNFLLLGGGAHRTGKKGGGWRVLRDFARETYPYAKEAYSWAAQDCMSLDHMPYIGPYSKHTVHLYTASGFQKWGMTGSMLSAMLLSDMVMGVKNDFAEIFSPSRSILKPQLFFNGFEAVKNLLTPSPKRCPHLGCALKWNRAEHSWDCACHGSRFSEDGTVLDNPANGNLK
ncbi:MAG: FAD-dependent oxidoreductase [Ruminococcus sp.]